jgi:glycosyltransferase involved in cell wall biosynthesis
VTAFSPLVTIDARLIEASGIGTYLQNLLPRIIESKPEWRFTLLGRPAELNELACIGRQQVTVVPCDAPIYGVGEQLQLARRVPRDTSLMWSPHYNIPLAYSGPLVVTVHDLCHLALPHITSGAHRRAYARGMFSLVKRRARRILCDSEFTRNEFCRLAGRPKEDPVVIHLGVDENWFNIPPGERPHPRPYLLYVGNVKPHKNLATLVSAFQTMASTIPHDLVIVGKQEGFITQDSKVGVAARELGARVRFTGPVSRQLLEQFFTHADVFVFPSLYEGFGLPPLEAMASGCPTIVSRAGSLPEVCGDAALYFHPDDGQQLAAIVTELLGNEEMRWCLQARGRTQAAKFSWDRCAKRTTEVFEELLSQ